MQGELEVQSAAAAAAEERSERWKAEAMASIEKYGSVDTARHAAAVQDVERLGRELTAAQAAAAAARQERAAAAAALREEQKVRRPMHAGSALLLAALCNLAAHARLLCARAVEGRAGERDVAVCTAAAPHCTRPLGDQIRS